MTTSSEDVLLQMSEVRFKKGDGTLYVMNERVAWMAENRDTVAVSHRFQDIKSMLINNFLFPHILISNSLLRLSRINYLFSYHDSTKDFINVKIYV